MSDKATDPSLKCGPACKGGDACSNSRIYISHLPKGVTADQVVSHFGNIGVVARERPRGRGVFPDMMPHRVKFYGNDDCLLQYEDSHAAHAAPSFFDDSDFNGSTIKVELAEKKPNQGLDADAAPGGRDSGGGGHYGGGGRGRDDRGGGGGRSGGGGYRRDGRGDDRRGRDDRGRDDRGRDDRGRDDRGRDDRGRDDRGRGRDDRGGRDDRRGRDDRGRDDRRRYDDRDDRGRRDDYSRSRDPGKRY